MSGDVVAALRPSTKGAKVGSQLRCVMCAWSQIHGEAKAAGREPDFRPYVEGVALLIRLASERL